SRIASIDDDLSGHNLAAAHNAAGESLLMITVERGQAEALKYLLSRSELSPLKMLMEDTNNDGATLFSAAVQTANEQTADVLLDYLLKRMENEADGETTLKAYLAKQDSKGRSVAHYLFNLPSFIPRIGHL